MGEHTRGWSTDPVATGAVEVRSDGHRPRRQLKILATSRGPMGAMARGGGGGGSKGGGGGGGGVGGGGSKWMEVVWKHSDVDPAA